MRTEYTCRSTKTIYICAVALTINGDKRSVVGYSNAATVCDFAASLVIRVDREGKETLRGGIDKQLYAVFGIGLCSPGSGSLHWIYG